VNLTEERWMMTLHCSSILLNSISKAKFHLLRHDTLSGACI